MVSRPQGERCEPGRPRRPRRLRRLRSLRCLRRRAVSLSRHITVESATVAAFNGLVSRQQWRLRLPATPQLSGRRVG